MPAPSAGAGPVSNGLETKQSMNEKNAATAARTGTTQATSSCVPRFSHTASAA